MSWLFSQALVEEYLVENYLDGEPSVQLSGSHTQQVFLPPDKMMDFSRLSQFGMMFKPLTESLGKELLMLYLEGFHVKTSAAQEEGKESQEIEAVCGSTWQESSEKYHQLSLTLKTPLCSALEDSVLSSKTLPRWGTMQNGECFQRQPLEQTTRGRGCGLLLPTPTCHNAKEGAYPAEYTRKTPTLATHVGGKIHPEYTEWMMGWPLGWTDLKPLATDKFQQWLKMHGESC